MNIDEMPAGPEMDALVAEKVMGCTSLVRKDYSWELTGGDVDSHSGTVWFCTCPGMHNDREDGLIKRYSKFISPSWEVVEKTGGCCFIIGRKKAAGIGYYDVRIWVDKEHTKEVIAFAPTASLAICRAALKVVIP